LREIWPEDEWISHTQALREAGETYHSPRNWRHLKADGSEIQVLTFGRRVAFNGRDGYLVAIVDITERRKAEARIAYMAHHDGLTNLPNRELYQERLKQVLEGGGNTRIAALCVDLDLFKNVNDSLGHPVGDRLLKLVAERLRAQVRGNNLAARLGGDEFAVILSTDVSPNEVSDFAARLIKVLSAAYDIDGNEVVIGASIGIALSPGDGTTSEELMRNADLALYRAKEDGGGVHRFFEREMDRQVQKRRDMELDLRRALANGEFELHYQPLVDIASDRISGFESLLRWRHPDKGMISPADFIPVAEDIGLIVAIGEWVLREACTEAVKWPSEVKVAVNLSPVQFRSRNLVQVVVSALAQSGLSPKRLEFEITESVFLAETEINLAILHQLRQLGVSISLDDFGTGYSSLSYLRSFPFDKIKIDRSFVKDLARRTDCVAIVRAISALAAASTSPRPQKGSKPSTSSTGCAPKAATRCRDSCSAPPDGPPKSSSCCLVSARARSGRRRDASEPCHDVRQHRPRAILVRLGRCADMDEAGELLVGLQTQAIKHIAVEGEPAGQPARAIAERGRGGDDVHRARTRGQFLLPWRHFWMRLGEADHADDQRRVSEALLLDVDLGRSGLRVFPRKHLCDDLAGAHARVTLENDEPPRRKLAMIGHPRADSQNGVELGGRGAGCGHLARLYGAASL
jgi:diguanylate cyclase (GGDEF)-like protein